MPLQGHRGRASSSRLSTRLPIMAVCRAISRYFRLFLTLSRPFLTCQESATLRKTPIEASILAAERERGTEALRNCIPPRNPRFRFAPRACPERLRKALYLPSEHGICSRFRAPKASTMASRSQRPPHPKASKPPSRKCAFKSVLALPRAWMRARCCTGWRRATSCVAVRCCGVQRMSEEMIG